MTYHFNHSEFEHLCISGMPDKQIFSLLAPNLCLNKATGLIRELVKQHYGITYGAVKEKIRNENPHAVIPTIRKKRENAT